MVNHLILAAPISLLYQKSPITHFRIPEAASFPSSLVLRSSFPHPRQCRFIPKLLNLTPILHFFLTCSDSNTAVLFSSLFGFQVCSFFNLAYNYQNTGCCSSKLTKEVFIKIIDLFIKKDLKICLKIYLLTLSLNERSIR